MEKQAASNQSGSDGGGGSSGGGGPIPSDLKKDFFNTGRVGRRNALPDILGTHCTTSTAELPDKFSSLSTSGE